MRAILVVVAVLAAGAGPAFAQGVASRPPSIEAVTLHRLHNEFYVCGEHFEGELPFLGDALGADCIIEGGLEGGFLRPFRTNGLTNEDWYGWNAEVLAPFDGTVFRVRVNNVTNQPGVPGQPPASAIVFERADGLHVTFAHLQDIRVAMGDEVRAGQVVGLVGNNGVARHPHVHVGAFRGDVPYQIRWDLRSGASRAP